MIYVLMINDTPHFAYTMRHEAEAARDECQARDEVSVFWVYAVELDP